MDDIDKNDLRTCKICFWFDNNYCHYYKQDFNKVLDCYQYLND